MYFKRWLKITKLTSLGLKEKATHYTFKIRRQNFQNWE